MRQINYVDYQSLDSTLREVLEKTTFPDSLSGPFRYPLKAAYFGELVRGRRMHDLKRNHALGMRSGSKNPEYYEILGILADLDRWYIQEFPIPIVDRDYYRMLSGSANPGKACFRIDFLVSPGVALELDDSSHNSWASRVEDQARDEYLLRMYGIKTVRVRGSSPELVELLKGLPELRPDNVPLFRDNNAALWCWRYPLQIEFLFQYMRHTGKPVEEIEVIHYYDVQSIMRGQVPGVFDTPGPWKYEADESVFLRGLRDLLKSLTGKTVSFV